MVSDLLIDAAKAWEKLCKTRYAITYGYKGKPLTFEKEDFFHLAGFPHMREIQLPRFNQSKIIEKVLDGKITDSMLSGSQSYESEVVPRLQALNGMEKALDNDFTLFTYFPKLYPFYTSIKADYLLSYRSENTGFMFIIRSSSPNANPDDFTFVSAFRSGSRDYKENQRERTILKKVKIDTETDEETVLFKSSHLNEDS